MLSNQQLIIQVKFNSIGLIGKSNGPPVFLERLITVELNLHLQLNNIF